MRGDRVGHLVEVVALKVKPFLGKAHVAVGVDKSGVDLLPGEIHHLLSRKGAAVGALAHWTQRGNLVSLGEEKGVGDGEEPFRDRFHRDKESVDKEHRQPPKAQK